MRVRNVGMHIEFPAGTRYFERDGVPYAQTPKAEGNHSVYNCALQPPQKLDDLQRLRDWEETSMEIFARLRAMHFAAQQELGVVLDSSSAPHRERLRLLMLKSRDLRLAFLSSAQWTANPPAKR